jgi:hypothetical protein
LEASDATNALRVDWPSALAGELEWNVGLPSINGAQCGYKFRLWTETPLHNNNEQPLRLPSVIENPNEAHVPMVAASVEMSIIGQSQGMIAL